MITLLKGIVVGMGGIAPGLSGSVLLVIFGLYKRAIDSVSTLFKNFKKNISFLFPLLLGFGIGILLFSKVIDFFLESFEMQTRFTFLGLVLGTVPLFYSEVKKNGFSKKYYLVIAVSAILGIALLLFSGELFPPVTEPNFFQSVLLGFAVAASSIVPGIDSAVILSAVGLYELYVSSLADMNFSVLLPAALGLAAGAVVISLIMSFLLKRFYTLTFSVIFGFFISIIPSVLSDACYVAADLRTVISFILLILGFLVSFYLGDIKGNNERLGRIFGKRNKQNQE